MDKLTESLKNAHNRECDAYELIKNVNFPKPEVYYLERRAENTNGIIAMEDFTGKATTVGIFRSLTVQQCLNAAKQFGAFQVWC